MKLKSLFVGETSNTFVQFFRYLLVGGTAFLVDFLIMVLFVEGLSLDKMIASAISFIVGLVVNYLISTFWIFKNSKIKNRGAEFLAFGMIGLVGLGINALIIWLFQDILSGYLFFGGFIPADKYYMIGKLVSTVVVFLWNFFARKFILFNKTEK